MVDFIRALQMTFKTGEVVIGSKKTLKLVLHGKARLVVLANNAPPELKRDIEYYAKLSNIPVFRFPGTNMELGALAGKPFGIAALAIVDPGQSNILELVEEGVET
ncbi:MAG: 50S ribosomal protein L30e [Crenarchaeota archaeon]|nr:50S ribosomal protein L30e [Thermoproteota archaeon]